MAHQQHQHRQKPPVRTVIRMGAAHYDLRSTVITGEEAHVDLAKAVWGLKREDRLSTLTIPAQQLAALHGITRKRSEHASRSKRRAAPRHHEPAAPVGYSIIRLEM